MTQPFKWVTKDGRHLTLKEMDDDHLKNTVRMLERSNRRLGLAFAMASTLQGEMAQLAAEQALDDEMENHIRRTVIIKMMTAELESRGVQL